MKIVTRNNLLILATAFIAGGLFLEPKLGVLALYITLTGLFIKE
jgi:hypothetical protein